MAALPTEPLTRETAKKVLRFTIGDEHPRDLQRIRAWESDGVSGEELSWSVGYGPRTHAFLRGNYHAEFFNGPHRWTVRCTESQSSRRRMLRVTLPCEGRGSGYCASATRLRLDTSWMKSVAP